MRINGHYSTFWQNIDTSLPRHAKLHNKGVQIYNIYVLHIIRGDTDNVNSEILRNIC